MTEAQPARAATPSERDDAPRVLPDEGEASERYDRIEDALRDVVDPELGIDIVDLGLVYDLSLDTTGALLITMTLTTAACPLTDMLEEQIGEALKGIVDSYRVEWVWSPPWTPDRITDEGRDMMRALGFAI